MNFNGTVSSDFMKLAREFDSAKKASLINYAGSDFNSIRTNLVNYVKSVYPLDYNNFVSSDLGVMLIDLVAYIGAVTSMKADFLANENYLRTAKNRNSIKKLLELIGVRMKGPTAAIANAKLTFPSDAFVSDPGATLTIPATSRVITVSSPEDGEPLSFTLYKVTNGLLENSNADSSIELLKSESVNQEGIIFNNLVLLEGALVKKTGKFNADFGIKSINLELAPIVEGSVEVFIEGVSDTRGRYTETENLFFVSGTDSKVFQLVADDDFRATVVFGDNAVAKSPAPGDTFTVTYRVGGGQRGNIGESFINAPLPLTIPGGASLQATLENTSVATGGANAETIDQAKKYAPLSFRRQDRLVTLSDYNSFCNSFRTNYGLVGKSVTAVRRAFSSANIIDIYVLEKANDLQLKKASPVFKRDLLEAIEPKKMITDDVVIVDGLVRTLDLVTTIRVSRELLEDEEAIKTKVANVITKYFSVGNRDFGESFIPQELAREIFALPEVVFATIDNYPQRVFVDFNEFIQLNNYTINIERV